MNINSCHIKINSYYDNSRFAIIVLHEIYGINGFIDDVCKSYNKKGYDVYCPEIMKRSAPFDYSQREDAYQYFNEKIGFEVFHEVNKLIHQLKIKYDKVFLIGFSIGATIAFRCTENVNCDGMIGYYGSRIRDYLEVVPECPVLLLFAKEDFFDVERVVEIVGQKQNVIVEILEGKHGFMDFYSDSYCRTSAEIAIKKTDEFLKLRTMS